MSGPGGRVVWLGALLAGVLVAGCAHPPLAPQVESAEGRVLARDARRVLYLPGPSDSLASLAETWLGNAGRAWEIASLNEIERVTPGQALVLPIVPVNPRGVLPTAVQSVPILAYHRIGGRANRMAISSEAFEAQLRFLSQGGWRVVSLAEFAEFLEGRLALPAKSVVLSFDDGHVSAWHYAYPLLRKYGVPATFFVTTDVLGGGDFLRWEQVREMAASGLADFQLHSRSHANLILRLPGESESAYRARIDSEIRGPRDLLTKQLGRAPRFYAYPFGDANALVVERVAAAGQVLGLTVNPGGNPFFAYPFMVRRTMVFGEHDLKAFEALLQASRSALAR